MAALVRWIHEEPSYGEALGCGDTRSAGMHMTPAMLNKTSAIEAYRRDRTFAKIDLRERSPGESFAHGTGAVVVGLLLLCGV